MEQHAGIGIRKSYLVLFVSVIFLRIKKNYDDYWSEAIAICGLAVFQSLQSHYYILTCSTCCDRVTLSAPQHFSYVVSCCYFFFFFMNSFLFMTIESWNFKSGFSVADFQNRLNVCVCVFFLKVFSFWSVIFFYCTPWTRTFIENLL